MFLLLPELFCMKPFVSGLNNNKMKWFSLRNISLILLLVITVVLHFINLKSLSLSNDELSAITRAKFDTFFEMIDKGVMIDYHPAGIQIFIFYWIKIFGDDDFLLRLPFVFCGIASAFLLYEICRKWFDDFAGLLSVVLFITSGLILQYTQIARMYSTGIFFCLIAVYGWTMYLFSENDFGKKKFWWIWLIGSILAIHNHYFSFAFVGIVGLSGLLFVKKEDQKRYLFGGLIALVSFIPELPIFFEQMKTGDIGGWLGPPEKTFLLDFFMEVFNHSYFFLTIISLWLLLGVVFPNDYKNVTRWRILSASWFFLIFLLAYLYSVCGHPVIQYSTLLFGLPFLFIFIVSFTPSFLFRYRIQTLLFLLSIGLGTLTMSGYYSKNHFGVFKEISDDVKNFPNSAPVVVNVINPVYFDYYYSKHIGGNHTIIYKVEGPGEYAQLMHTIDTCSSKEFGYVWSNAWHPYEVNEIIRKKYPFLILKKEYFNATSYLYSKDSAHALNDALLVNFSQVNFEKENPNSFSIEKYFSKPTSEFVNSKRDYSNAFKIAVSQIPGENVERRYAVVTAKVYFDKLPEKAAMVLAFDDSTVSVQYQNVIFSDFCSSPGKWYDMLLCGEFPTTYHPNAILKAYFSNLGGEEFYIDDFNIVIRSSNDPYKK